MVRLLIGRFGFLGCWSRFFEWAMIVPACIVLIIAVTATLRKQMIHAFTHTSSPAPAWNHVPRVEKNAFLTLKQTLKNVATTKSNRIQLQSCGMP